MNRRQLFGFFGGAVVAPLPLQPSLDVAKTASIARAIQIDYNHCIQRCWTSTRGGYFYLRGPRPDEMINKDGVWKKQP